MSKNPYQRWFVNSHYSVAGRPKMEDELMNFAREKWMDCLVYETDIPRMVVVLKEKQEKIYAENKRLKKVEISTSKYTTDGDCWLYLYIGAQHLCLRRVAKEIECI